MDTLCCPNCGFYQLVEDNYCLRCGLNMFLFAADHSVVMICPECKEAGKGHYCKKCGNKLIGQSIHRRKKILSVVYLVMGVGLVFAGGYWIRSAWIGWKTRIHPAKTLQYFAQFSSRQNGISTRKPSEKTVGKLKGLAKEDLTDYREKEKVSRQLTSTAAKKIIPKKGVGLSLSRQPATGAKTEPPPLDKKEQSAASPLEEEDLFKKGLQWFEKELPRLRAQGMVDRVEESDPFVVYIYWAKWRYLSPRKKKDLLNQVKTARENMDFDEVVEFRDANSRELLISTSIPKEGENVF